jgi:hypothetical protein
VQGFKAKDIAASAPNLQFYSVDKLRDEIKNFTQ